MAQTTWVSDAPSGVYKNHAMSMMIYQAAIEDTIGMMFVRTVDGAGRGRGETVTLTRRSNLTQPTTAELLETERIPEYPFSLTTTAVTLTERGGSVPYTNLYEELSEFDVTSEIQMALKDQLALVIDTSIFTSFKTCLVKYVPSGVASSTITTNGTFGGTAASNMNVFHAEEISAYMYDTLKAPYWEDESYIGIFRNRALLGIRRDPSFEEWWKYTDPSVKFKGEVGTLEQIKFIRTNHAAAFGNVGTSSVLGEGVVFGKDAVAMAEALTPELRAGIPTDAGRAKQLYWYGILGFGLIWTTANAGEARVMHVGSL